MNRRPRARFRVGFKLKSAINVYSVLWDKHPRNSELPDRQIGIARVLPPCAAANQACDSALPDLIGHILLNRMQARCSSAACAVREDKLPYNDTGLAPSDQVPARKHSRKIHYIRSRYMHNHGLSRIFSRSLPYLQKQPACWRIRPGIADLTGCTVEFAAGDWCGSVDVARPGLKSRPCIA